MHTSTLARASHRHTPSHRSHRSPPPAGLEPAIPGSVGRCLICYFTGPGTSWGRRLPPARFQRPSALTAAREPRRHKMGRTNFASPMGWRHCFPTSRIDAGSHESTPRNTSGILRGGFAKRDSVRRVGNCDTVATSSAGHGVEHAFQKFRPALAQRFALNEIAIASVPMCAHACWALCARSGKWILVAGC